MPTLDSAHHELEFRIMVVGAESDAFAQALPLKDGHLYLGELQGWRPHLSFTCFATDPWAGDGSQGAKLERLLPHTDALVLTDALREGHHYSSTAMERLSRVLRPAMTGLPAAIYGGHALEQEWTTLSGRAPIRVAEPVKENAMVLVKAICSVLLRSKMRSVPPPPVGS
jgi:hypothetical protein